MTMFIAACGAALAVSAADIGGTQPRLFLNADNLPSLRKRCAPGGDFASVLDAWRREAKAAVGAAIPPEPDWLPDERML